MVRSKHYGLILCDYNLNHKTDGQQLFEFLREAQLLPPDTLFFMITAESNYNSVAAASEHMPDAYLLKPITAGDIEDRLKSQLDKRHALLDITKALSKGDLAGALLACDAVLAKKDRWFMYALQLKAQTLLDLGNAEEARLMFQSALDLRAGLMWAQIGLARAYKAAGKFDEAKRLALGIIATPEGEKNLAAFDVAGQAMEALGDPASAMQMMKKSARWCPRHGGCDSWPKAPTATATWPRPRPACSRRSNPARARSRPKRRTCTPWPKPISTLVKPKRRWN